MGGPSFLTSELLMWASWCWDLGQDSPSLKFYYLSLWLSLLQWKTLLVEKTVKVELGESRPCTLNKNNIFLLFLGSPLAALAAINDYNLKATNQVTTAKIWTFPLLSFTKTCLNMFDKSTLFFSYHPSLSLISKPLC